VELLKKLYTILLYTEIHSHRSDTDVSFLRSISMIAEGV